MFPEGSIEGNITCFEFRIVDDSVFEKLENFTVNVTSETNVNFNIQEITIGIEDNDGTLFVHLVFSFK